MSIKLDILLIKIIKNFQKRVILNLHNVMCQCNAMINHKANQYQYICPIPCLDILCHENKLSINILHKNCKFCGTIIPYYTGEVKVN